MTGKANDFHMIAGPHFLDCGNDRSHERRVVESQISMRVYQARGMSWVAKGQEIP